MKEKIKISQLVKDNNLVVLGGEKGLDRYIEKYELSRPGFEMVGFFDFFEPSRLVLFGSKESTFFKERLSHDEQDTFVCNLFAKNPPALVFSCHVDVPEIFIRKSDKFNVPVLKSNLVTTATSSKLYGYLIERLAERISVHGVLVDIHGLGTLIIGKSGIGKSEVAMELIKRGHRLVSDDRVDIFEREVGTVIGKAPKLLEKYMEIRGIGVVNVTSLFGVSAYRESKKIRFVVELEKWEAGKNYDRIGLEKNTTKFFNTEIPKIVLPVAPGRNIASLVESAAMNERLKYMGYNSAEIFVESLHQKINESEDN